MLLLGKIAPSTWGSGPHLTHGSLGPPKSPIQMASQTVQSFCRAHKRDQQTDRQTHCLPDIIIAITIINTSPSYTSFSNLQIQFMIECETTIEPEAPAKMSKFLWSGRPTRSNVPSWRTRASGQLLQMTG